MSDDGLKLDKKNLLISFNSDRLLILVCGHVEIKLMNQRKATRQQQEKK